MEAWLPTGSLLIHAHFLSYYQNVLHQNDYHLKMTCRKFSSILSLKEISFPESNSSHCKCMKMFSIWKKTSFFFWKRRSLGPLASVEKQNGIGDFRKSMKDFRTCTTIESKWSVMWPKTIETIHSILWNEEVEGGKEYDIKNCVCISKV